MVPTPPTVRRFNGGRDQLIAEIGSGGAQRAWILRGASMGPRDQLIAEFAVDLVCIHEVDISASMGPRSADRGISCRSY